MPSRPPESAGARPDTAPSAASPATAAICWHPAPTMPDERQPAAIPSADAAVSASTPARSDNSCFRNNCDAPSNATNQNSNPPASNAQLPGSAIFCHSQGRSQPAKTEHCENKQEAQRSDAVHLRPYRAAERQHQQRRPAIAHAPLLLLHAQPKNTQPFQRPVPSPSSALKAPAEWQAWQTRRRSPAPP